MSRSRVHAALRGDLRAMASHPLANFVVQALAASAPRRKELSLLLAEVISHPILYHTIPHYTILYNELSLLLAEVGPAVPELVAQRAGVVWKLASACSRLGGGGAALLSALGAADEADGGGGGGDGGDLARAILRVGAYAQQEGGNQGGGKGGGKGGGAPAAGLVVGNLGSGISRWGVGVFVCSV